MPFIGQQPITGAYSKLDSITTSATATYNLQLNGGAYYPQSANHLLVSLNGVMQAPQDSFTVSGSQITFASALTSSDNIDFIMALGDVLDIGTPSDGSVNTSQLANSAVTTAKLASTLDLSGKTVTMPAGSVLQVVSTTKTDIYSQTATSYTEVTGLTASITPISSSSKILITVGVLAAYDDDGTTSRRAAFSIFRGNTNLIVPTSPSNRIGGMVEIMENVTRYGSVNIGYSFLDSPATTSSTSYSVRAKNHGGGSSTLYVNRGSDDEDSSITVRGASTITLMEIAG